jgi:hypothetical protein
MSNPLVWRRAKDRATRKEAERIRRLMVEAFNKGGPKGKRWPRLTALHQLINRAQGKGDRKPLLDTADLRNSHAVTDIDDGYFVGIHRTAKGRKSGQDMINIALVQENGAGPFTIAVTDRMRAFWMWLHIKTKGQIMPLKKSTTQVVVRVRPRPWVGPIWEAEKERSAQNIVRDTMIIIGGATVGGLVGMPVPGPGRT